MTAQSMASTTTTAPMMTPATAPLLASQQSPVCLAQHSPFFQQSDFCSKAPAVPEGRMESARPGLGGVYRWPGCKPSVHSHTTAACEGVLDGAALIGHEGQGGGDGAALDERDALAICWQQKGR